MVKVLTVELVEDEPEVGYGAARPVRLRRDKKRSLRMRAKSRRVAPKPGGIHRRAHKRMTW